MNLSSGIFKLRDIACGNLALYYVTNFSRAVLRKPHPPILVPEPSFRLVWSAVEMRGSGKFMTSVSACLMHLCIIALILIQKPEIKKAFRGTVAVESTVQDI